MYNLDLYKINFLYSKCKIDVLPFDIINNRNFMILRFDIYCKKYIYELFHEKNVFRNEYKFISKIISNIRKNLNIDVKHKYFRYILNNISNDINMVKYIIRKHSFLYFYIIYDLANLNKNLFIIYNSLYNDLNFLLSFVKNIYCEGYALFTSIEYIINKNINQDLCFSLIKSLPRRFKIQKTYCDRIYTNLLSRNSIFLYGDHIYYENVMINLQLIHSSIEKVQFICSYEFLKNESCKSYCVQKYGAFKIFNEMFKNRNPHFIKKLDERCVMLNSKDTLENLPKIMYIDCFIYLFKNMLNLKQLDYKYIPHIFYYNNQIIKLMSYTKHQTKNIGLFKYIYHQYVKNFYDKEEKSEKIISLFFYKKYCYRDNIIEDDSIEFIFVFLNENLLNFFLIKPKIQYNKKILEKISYFYPEFVYLLNRSSYFINFNFYLSNKITYCKTKYKNLPEFMKNNFERFSSIVEDSYIEEKIKYDKNKLLEFILENKNGSILKNIPEKIKDYDLISSCLKYDENAIIYTPVEYINEYINCKFDMEKTLEKMKV